MSGLGMHCLPMSHKKDNRLIWVERDTDLMHQDILYLLTMLPITSTTNWHLWPPGSYWAMVPTECWWYFTLVSTHWLITSLITAKSDHVSKWLYGKYRAVDSIVISLLKIRQNCCYNETTLQIRNVFNIHVQNANLLLKQLFLFNSFKSSES